MCSPLIYKILINISYNFYTICLFCAIFKVGRNDGEPSWKKEH